jgi:hypothetical protein
MDLVPPAYRQAGLQGGCRFSGMGGASADAELRLSLRDVLQSLVCLARTEQNLYC